jgi:hypothetical protein
LKFFEPIRASIKILTANPARPAIPDFHRQFQHESGYDRPVGGQNHLRNFRCGGKRNFKSR